MYVKRLQTQVPLLLTRKLPSLVFELAVSFSEVCGVLGSELTTSVDFSFGLVSGSAVFLVVLKTDGVSEGRGIGTGFWVTVGEGGLCFNELGDGGRFLCANELLFLLKFYYEEKKKKQRVTKSYINPYASYTINTYVSGLYCSLQDIVTSIFRT